MKEWIKNAMIYGIWLKAQCMSNNSSVCVSIDNSCIFWISFYTKILGFDKPYESNSWYEFEDMYSFHMNFPDKKLFLLGEHAYHMPHISWVTITIML